MLWKWIFSIVFTLIAALIITAYGILSRCDVNRLKPLIIEQVKNATGRELKLGGEIVLAIGLRPALVLDGVSFQNAAWASHPQMIKVKRLEMQVALVPLLFGDIEVKRFFVIEPEVFVERHPSGKWNIELGKRGKEPVPASKGRSQSWLSLFYFKDMQLTEGRLIYQDHRSGRSHSLVLNTFRARAAKPEMPVKVSLKGAYEQNPVMLEGMTGSVAALFNADKTWPLKVRGKLAGNTFSVEGALRDVFEGKGLRMSVEMKGRSVRRASRLAGLTGVPEMGPFRVSVEITNLKGPLRLKNIKALIGTEDLVKLDLAGTVREPMKRRGIDLRFSAKGKDLAKLKRVTKTFPAVTGSFEVSGRAVVNGLKKYTFSEVKASQERMDFEGYGEIDVSKRTPSVKAFLTSGKMDLRPLLSKRKKKLNRGVRIKTRRVFPGDSLPFHLLRKINGQVRLRAEKALLPQLTLTAVDLDVVLQDGCLTARRFKCKTGGGTVEGFLDLLPQGKTAKMDMEMTLRHVDVGGMLRRFKAKKVLAGDLDADIDIQASGDSIAELMAGLDGKICVIMGTGRINKEYISLLEADLGAGVSRLFNPGRENTDYTEFNCFVNGFDIKDGLAEVTALVLDTDHTSVIGEGRINLGTEQLDLSLKPFHKKGIQTGIFGKLNLSFGELAKPFRLEGTLGEPTCALDPGQTAIIFGKAVGGVMLFGPLGIAVALAGCSPGNDNPCLSAIEAAKKGVRISE
ncbi:MAG: AsmA family protein [Deltaproteobacteria bacterium]